MKLLNVFLVILITTILWSSSAHAQTYRRGTPWEAPENGTITKITGYFVFIDGSTKADITGGVNLFQDGGASSHSEVDLGEILRASQTIPGWNDISVNAGITGGVDYILNVMGDKSDFTGALQSIGVRGDDASGPGQYEDQHNYSSPEDPWTTSFSQSDVRLSVYATYTGDSSCSYSSGDWNVNYSDNCSITEDVNVSGACNFVYDGAGSFSLSAVITCQDVNGGAGFRIDGTSGSARIEIVSG